MCERPEVWLVVRDEELVAELEVERLDGSWFCGHAVRRDGFWLLQDLFDEEQRLATRVEQDPAAWWRAYRRVRRAVRLIRPDGQEAAEFILHIDGRRARWRCWNRETTDRMDRPASIAPPPGRARIVRRALAAAVVAAAAALAAPAAALAQPIRHQHSSNWAGYAVTAAAPFRSVAGRWVQPAAKCDQGSPTWSAFWVGIGGFTQGSQKLAQIGSEADCTTDGWKKMTVWYELAPAAPVTVRLPVRAGDQIAARVTITGQHVALGIQNLTTHRSFTKTVAFPSPDTSSAEWIAEAPSECDNAGQCQPLPLTDFGTVRFTNSTATTAGGRSGTIADPAFTTTEITLSGGAPVIGPQPVSFAPKSGAATPSGLSGHGDAFAVDFKYEGPSTAPPPPPTAAPDQIRHTPVAALHP
jgi:Peptidase A4 family